MASCKVTIITRQPIRLKPGRQVTGDLINNDKVDIVVAASTPDTTVPVSDQAETFETPCLTCDCPWESWVGTRSGGNLDAQFKWTYHVFWGAEDVAATMLDAWPNIQTNKVIATMFPNDADGNALRPIYMPLFEQAGYTVVDGGAFQDLTEDFTAQIAAFKKAGAEIGTGIFSRRTSPTSGSRLRSRAGRPKLRPTPRPSSSRSRSRLLAISRTG
jgi:branched-chain amino acid transport system substrate-binding protein